MASLKRKEILFKAIENIIKNENNHNNQSNQLMMLNLIIWSWYI